MPLIEWATPLMHPLRAIRSLQYAANSLDVNEWCAAMHWPRDEYSEAKFRDMQEIGRLLARFDNGVLTNTLSAYDRQLERRAGASQAVPSNACSSCHMVDPCGYHFSDCTLLEPGDFVVPAEYRGTTGWVREERGVAWVPSPCAGCGEPTDAPGASCRACQALDARVDEHGSEEFVGTEGQDRKSYSGLSEDDVRDIIASDNLLPRVEALEQGQAHVERLWRLLDQQGLQERIEALEQHREGN